MSIPLSSPRQIPCDDCRARENTSCKRTKPGSIRLQYLKGFHAKRREAYKRILAANPDATTDPETWVAPHTYTLTDHVEIPYE